MKRFAKSILLLIVLSVPVFLSAQNPVPSDFQPISASWEASPITTDCSGFTDAAGNSWTNLLFDDSTWSKFTPPDAGSFNTLGVNPADRYYRGTFSISSTTQSVFLFFVSDDGIEIFINGTPLTPNNAFSPRAQNICHQLGCVNITGCGPGFDLDVAPVQVPVNLLKPGINIIAAHVSNGGGGSYFDMAVLANNTACQVNWKPTNLFHQYAFGLEPGVPEYFGFPTSDFSNGCVTRQTGCALTTAATMLSSFFEQETPALLDTELKGLQPPGYALGTFGDTKLQTDCDLIFNDIPSIAPARLTFFGGDINQNGQFLDHDTGQFSTLEDYLGNHVCKDQDRVILRLEESVTVGNQITASGEHFILVTGQAQNGSDWTVFDPGWNPNKSTDPGIVNPPSANLFTLNGHKTGFFNPSPAFNPQSAQLRQFTVSGIRTYRDSSSMSSSNSASLGITANSPVELLVTDPLGRRLGHPLNSDDLFEIPMASYFRDFPFADDTGAGTGNGDSSGIKTIYVPIPATGLYRITTNGTGLGTYTLNFRAIASDGSIQGTTAIGTTNQGLASSYAIQYDSTPGAALTVKRLVTTQSTLSDINNGLSMGLIKSEFAQSLLEMIARASGKAARGDLDNSRHILEEFKQKIREQTSKKIDPVIAQILLNDADVLLQAGN